MYDPAAVNEIANIIVFIATLPFLLSTLAYGLLAPWHRSLLGTTLFGLLASSTAVLAFIFSRRVWGAYWGYEWVAIIAYTSLTAFATALLLMFFVERDRAGLLEFPLIRRDQEGKS